MSFKTFQRPYLKTVKMNRSWQIQPSQRQSTVAFSCVGPVLRILFSYVSGYNTSGKPYDSPQVSSGVGSAFWELLLHFLQLHTQLQTWHGLRQSNYTHRNRLPLYQPKRVKVSPCQFIIPQFKSSNWRNRIPVRNPDTESENYIHMPTTLIQKYSVKIKSWCHKNMQQWLL